MTDFSRPIDHRPFVKAMAGKVGKVILSCGKQTANPHKPLAFLFTHLPCIGKTKSRLDAITPSPESLGQRFLILETQC